MAQDSVWPRGKYGPKALAVEREPGMPNRKHASVKAMQTTGRSCAINRTL
jgi:hypothetical protein